MKKTLTFAASTISSICALALEVLFREAMVARRADAVRFVGEDHVDAVGFGVAEIVEVTYLRFGLRSENLPEVLGERFAARCVLSVDLVFG